MKRIFLITFICFFSGLVQAAELAGVYVEDKIQSSNGDALVLNGLGLREKLWIDVYVGSLYLEQKSQDVAEILSRPGPLRLQLDFIYKKVSPQQLTDTWREGFEKNQDDQTLEQLKDRIDQFCSYFSENAVAKDRYILDYVPGEGTQVSKNGRLLGKIQGEDFKNALLEIWLGNHPADKNLKKGMLGL